MDYFYAIVERSYDFCVIETGYGQYEKIWNRANELAELYPDLLNDYDVLLFDSERDRIEFFRAETTVGFQIGA